MALIDTSGTIPTLNLGGPGWFSDVFDVAVAFDSEVRVNSTGAVFREEAAVFDPDGSISGTITLTPPPGCSVAHRGVSLRIDSYISFYATFRTAELPTRTAHEVRVAPAATLSAPTVLRFSLDLAGHTDRESRADGGGSGGMDEDGTVIEGRGDGLLQLFDSYGGESCSLRHSLTVTVARPFYTFDVIACEPICIQRLWAASPFSGGGTDGGGGGSGGGGTAAVVAAAAAARANKWVAADTAWARCVATPSDAPAVAGGEPDVGAGQRGSGAVVTADGGRLGRRILGLDSIPGCTASVEVSHGHRDGKDSGGFDRSLDADVVGCVRFNFSGGDGGGGGLSVSHPAVRANPISVAELLVIKVEAAEGEATERTVAELQLLEGSDTEGVARRSAVAAGAASSDGGREGNAATDKPSQVTDDAELPFRLQLSEWGLSPTYMCVNGDPNFGLDWDGGNDDSGGDASDASDDPQGIVPPPPSPNEDAFAVRYFLRLRVVLAQGQVYWNTTELRLWRRIFSDVVTNSLNV